MPEIVNDDPREELRGGLVKLAQAEATDDPDEAVRLWAEAESLLGGPIDGGPVTVEQAAEALGAERRRPVPPRPETTWERGRWITREGTKRIRKLRSRGRPRARGAGRPRCRRRASLSATRAGPDDPPLR